MMSRYAIALLLAGAFGIGIAGRTTPASYPAPLAVVPWKAPQNSMATTDFASPGPNEIVEQFCLRCHSARRQVGGLVLEGFDIAEAAQRRPMIEKMIRKLRAGLMPPAGVPRPEPEVVAAMAGELEATMDRIAASDPNPGRRTFQRLNRAEYANAVKDLLGLEVDMGAFLPLDTKSANFDNIADVQMPSATVMEGYLRAAGQISRLALGDPEAEVSSTSYRIPRVASQKEQVEGAPIGTRGGLSVLHNFPADGKYVFHIMPYNAVEGEVFGRTFGTEQIEVSIDGTRVALLTIDRWMSESEPTGLNIRTDSIYVTAGQKRVSAAFIRQFEGVVDDLVRPIDHTLADGQIGIGYGVTTQQHLQRLTVLGPFDVTGVSDTPARRAVFTCRPTLPEEALPCARRIIDRVVTRAYRRPATESDIEGLLGFYEMGAADGGFEKGIRTALQAILASPHFVFRLERPPADTGPDGIYRIADADLASRLSFFLWGAPPDDELLRLARAGTLSDPAELERQARRLLADPRAEALATRFAPGAGARELRRDGVLADPRRGQPGGPRGDDVQRQGAHQPGRPSGRAPRYSGRGAEHLHREPDGLRPRPPGRVL